MEIALRLKVALLCLVFAAPALAAGPCDGYDPSQWTAENTSQAARCISKLATFDAADCKGNKDGVCGKVATWLDRPRDEKVAAASGLLREIRDSLAKAAPGSPGAERVQKEINRWLRDMTLATREDLRSRNEGPYRKEPVEKWRYVTGQENRRVVLEGSPNEIRIDKLLETECTASAARCERALRDGGQIALHSTLAGMVASGLLDDLRQEAADYVNMLDKRWENYFSASRFQWPWELALNSARYKPEKLGLVSPPEDQVIFLHPSAAVRYSNKGAQNFEPMLVLEVIGMHKWRWAGSEARDVLGGSLIVAWANQQGERKPGVGALVHFKSNYSLGIVRHTVASGTTTSVVLSFDLGKAFEDRQDVKKTLQGLLD